jgi:hypothetical protein
MDGVAHELLTHIAKLLVIVHVLAALKHQFWDNHGLLGRMVPTRRSRSQTAHPEKLEPRNSARQGSRSSSGEHFNGQQVATYLHRPPFFRPAFDMALLKNPATSGSCLTGEKR